MQHSTQPELGYTVIEMLVTIMIIGILAVLVFYAPKSFLVSSRDSERSDDVASIARRLEQAYLNQDLGGPGYPSTTKLLSDISSRSNTMSRLKPEASQSPGGATSSVIAATSTSLSTPASGGAPSIKQYVYQPLKANASGGWDLCTSTTDLCTRFFLYYRLEANNTIQIIKSLHQQ